MTLNSVQQTAPDTVLLDITLSGPSLPPIAVPFRNTYTVTVSNGRVLRMVETIPPETFAALAALGRRPGMPATGAGLDGLLIPLLGLVGLAALVMGAGMRQQRLPGR